MPYAIIGNFPQKNGVVSEQDLDASAERTKAKLMPPISIKALSRQRRKAHQFSKEAGEEIQKASLCRACYNKLHATGLFSQSCYEWRMLQTDSSKTYTHFQLYFTLASKNRKNTSDTTQNAGYHTVSNTINVHSDNTTVGIMNSTTFGTISVLTETIAE